MKLCNVVGSPNCRKVLAVAHHLGLQLEIDYLDFFSGELRSPDYRRANPNGMVPTLRDGDFVLWESNAIMQYLADLGAGSALFPRDARARADVVRWQCWELAHYNKAFGVLSFETVAKPGFMGAQPDAGLVAWSQGELERFTPVLESHLAGRRYLVGDGITIADYSLIHLEGFKDAVPFDWSRFPGVNAYYQRMRDVSHWSATAPSSREAIGRKPAVATA